MEILKKLETSEKEWPSDHHLRAYYDEQFILDFFQLDDGSSGQGFFTRYFVKKLCETFNKERPQKMMKALDLTPKFDQLLQTRPKTMICRFVLPFNPELRKAAMVFLFDVIYNDQTQLYTEKVLFDDHYFIMVSKRIS